jgi:uncharacterized membrane protein YdjX (TVP38/TMEM64 family)
MIVAARPPTTPVLKMRKPMPEHEPSRRSPTPLRRWTPLVVLALVAAVAWFQWGGYLTLEAVDEQREVLKREVEANFAGALAVYAAAYVMTVAASLPGGVFLTLIGGFLFGWSVGGVVTVFAATAGATVIFLVARSSIGSFLAERAGPWLERLRAGFARDAVNYLLFLRLVPAFPFWLVNIAPALLGMDLPRFVIATFIGIIPGTFAFTFLGAGLDSLIAAQEEAYEACVRAAGAAEGESAGKCSFTLDPGSLLTPELIAAFVTLGIVALIPVIWRRVRGA